MELLNGMYVGMSGTACLSQPLIFLDSVTLRWRYNTIERLVRTSELQVAVCLTGLTKKSPFDLRPESEGYMSYVIRHKLRFGLISLESR